MWLWFMQFYAYFHALVSNLHFQFAPKSDERDMRLRCMMLIALQTCGQLSACDVVALLCVKDLQTFVTSSSCLYVSITVYEVFIQRRKVALSAICAYGNLVFGVAIKRT